MLKAILENSKREIFCIGNSKAKIMYQKRIFLIKPFLDFLRKCSTDNFLKKNEQNYITNFEGFSKIKNNFAFYVCGNKNGPETYFLLQYSQIYNHKLKIFRDDSLSCQKGVYFYTKWQNRIFQFEESFDISSFDKFVILNACQGIYQLENFDSEDLEFLKSLTCPLAFLHLKSQSKMPELPEILYSLMIVVVSKETEKLELIIGKDELDKFFCICF